MPNYRIRWKAKGTATYINSGDTGGIFLPGTAVSITNITGANSGTTITVTTGTTNHNFAIGQGIVISGVTPSGLNGLVEVTAVGTLAGGKYTFSYEVASSPGLTYTSGGTATPTQGIEKTISSISGSAGTVTVTTALAHGYKVGEPVRITGVSVAGYNTTTTVASVPSTTTFTYSNATTTAGATGGTSVSQGVFTLRTANCSSGNSISSGTSYDIEVTYDNGGTLAWSGSAVTATPLAAVVDTTNLTVTDMTGTNATTTSGTTDGSVTRVAFSDATGTLLYGIRVDFLNSWSSWKTCTCTITYMGKTYSITATKATGAAGKSAFFPVPLGANVTVTAAKQGSALNGSIVVTPYG